MDKAQRKSVGVLVRGAQTGRSLAFLEGMTQCANDLDVSLVLQKFGLAETDSALSGLKKALHRESSLSGVLIIHHWPVEVVQYLADHFDCVSMIHTYPGIAMDVVDMNHVLGINQLMGHLYTLGHRRIGFIGRNAELAWAKARFGGYSQTLYGLNLPYDPEHVVDIPTLLLEDPSLIDQWDPIINRVAEAVKGGVTAWMASSDWAGYALCHGLMARGFRVPEDVSITGFDTDDPQMPGCPRLTSVNVPKQEMGGEALRRLLRRSDEPQQPQHTSLFECALFPGQTTAAPSR